MAEPDPQMRCSDADREKVVNELQEHYAAGRLTLEEFQERSDTAYAAKTFGDLAGLTADLPATAVEQPEPQRPARRISPATRNAVGSWLSVGLVCSVVWLLTVITSGHVIGFWPMWVIGPWGAVMLAGLVGGTHKRRQGDDSRGVNPHEERRRQVEEYRRAHPRAEHHQRQRQERRDHRRDPNHPHGEIS